MRKLYIDEGFKMVLPDNHFTRDINGSLKLADCSFVDDFLVIDCNGKSHCANPEIFGFERDEQGWFFS